MRTQIDIEKGLADFRITGVSKSKYDLFDTKNKKFVYVNKNKLNKLKQNFKVVTDF